MDPKSMLWNAPPPPGRKPRPGEKLFEFVRASDRAPMSCELRFHGETWAVGEALESSDHFGFRRSGFAQGFRSR
jgi:hypothetical protein